MRNFYPPLILLFFIFQAFTGNAQPVASSQPGGTSISTTYQPNAVGGPALAISPNYQIYTYTNSNWPSCQYFGMDISDLENSTPSVGISFWSSNYSTNTSFSYVNSSTHRSNGQMQFTGLATLKYVTTSGVYTTRNIDIRAIITIYESNGTTPIPLIRPNNGNYVMAAVDANFKVSVQLQADANDLSSPMWTGSSISGWQGAVTVFDAVHTDPAYNVYTTWSPSWYTTTSLTAPDITGGDPYICYNTSPGTLTAGISGGIGTGSYVDWYKTGSGTILHTDNSAPYTYTPLNVTTTTTYYYVHRISDHNSCSATSNEFTVNVAAELDPGSIGTTISPAVCGSPVTPAFTNISGSSGGYGSQVGGLSYQWEVFDPYNAPTWTSIGGTNATTYDPPNNLSTGMIYRRRTDDNGVDEQCPSVYTNEVRVDVLPPMITPTVTKSPGSATKTTCHEVDVTLTASGIAPGGNGLNFDNNDRIDVSSLPIGSSWTLEAWFEWPLTSNGSSWNTLFRGVTTDHHIIVDRANGNWLGTYRNGAGNFLTSGFDMDVLNSGWHHIAAVGTGSTTTFYIDGNLVGTAAGKSTEPIQTIGNHNTGGQSWGKVDNVRIWSDVRTGKEIIDNMYYETPLSSGGLLAHYKMDGNANDATGTYNGTFPSTPATITPQHYNYLWSGGSNSPVFSPAAVTTAPTVTIVDPTYDQSGSYAAALQVSDGTGTCNQGPKGNVQVNVNGVLGAPVVNNDNPTNCGPYTLVVQPGYLGNTARFYNDVPPTAGGTGALLDQNTSYVVNSSDTIFITSYNANTDTLCESSLYTEVRVFIGETFTLDLDTSDYNGFEISCTGASDGFVTATIPALEGSPPFTYQWSNGTTYSTSSRSHTISGLTAGYYEVTVTDTFGCVQADNRYLLEPDPIAIAGTLSTSNYGSYNVNCNGNSNGSIDITASGGTGTYSQYTWSDGPTTEDRTGTLSAASYTVTVQDNNSCTASKQFTITEPNTITINHVFNYTCDGTGYTGGSVTVIGSGGVSGSGIPVYQYAQTLTSGSPSYGTGNTFNFGPGDDGDTWRLWVKDANGCTNYKDVLIDIPSTGGGGGGGAALSCEKVYVSSTGGGTLGNKGCPTNLLTAINIADTSTTRDHIVMEEGTYTFGAPIEIPSDVIIDGGYEVVSGEWIKNSSAQTKWVIGPPDETSGANIAHKIGVKAIGESNFTIMDVTIEVAKGQYAVSGQTNGYGKSVYGIYLSGCSSYDLIRLDVSTGNATKGSDGSKGANGKNRTSNMNGSKGGSGGGCDGCDVFSGWPFCDSNQGGAGGPAGVGSGGAAAGTSASGRNGGGGGNGGNGGRQGNHDGYAGQCGGGSNSVEGTGLNCDGGGGGDGCRSPCNPFGSWSCRADDGVVGGDGADGVDGGDAGLGNAGSISGGFWTPGAQANSGGDGGGGQGGRGGGGGGGQGGICALDGAGDGGGGGGGGGQGGAGGTGGKGGGSAYGIFANSNGSSGRIINCNVTAGSAGAGGIGAGGGTGGPGGIGGNGQSSCPSDVGEGRKGGDGGTGGDGGKGGDGRPGESVAKYYNGTNFNTNTTTIPTSPVVTVIQNKGCTNSEIILTKSNSSAWTSFGGGLLLKDIDAATSSFVMDDSPVTISYSSTGQKTIVTGGATFTNFVNITTARSLPTITPIDDVCPGVNDVITLNTPVTATGYYWSIATPDFGSGSVVKETYDPGAQTHNNINTSGWGKGTYLVKLQTYDDCCGWSVPVYTSFDILDPPDNIGEISHNLTQDTTQTSATEYECGNVAPFPPFPLLPCGWSTSPTCAGACGPTPTGQQRSAGTSIDTTYNGCQGGTYEFSIDPVQYANDYIWSAPTGATIDAGQGTPSVTVTFGSSSGNVTVAVGGCNPLPPSKSIFVTLHPDGYSVDASVFTGSNPNCAGENTVLIGTTSNPFDPFTYLWTGGTTSQTKTITSGGTYSVTITNKYGCKGEDNIVITDIDPTADAGADQSVCANNSDVTLNGSVSDATGGTWSNGGGTYNPNANTLNAVYTPSAGEISAGTASLILTTTGNSGGCSAGMDTMDITITTVPTVDAGSNQTVCANNADITLDGAVTVATGGTWSGGGGTYNPDANTLNAVYTPSAGEITAGTVTLTLTTTGNGGCAAVDDDVIFTITDAPTVDAGNDQTVCANNADVTLNGAITVATGGVWSGGAGTYNPNNTTLNAVYTPSAGEVSAGTVILTLTTTGNGNCTAVADDIEITITDAPTVDAGIDQALCGNNADVTLDGTVTVASGGIWSGGAGTYNPNNTTLNAVYTPSAGEVSAGSATLTLTTTGNGNCLAEDDDMTITLTTIPTADAGADQSVCANNPDVTLDGAVTGATGSVWSGGAGTFNPDNTTLNAVYTPTAGEITAGSVTLTLTTTGNGDCSPVADDVIITITPTPVVNAGSDQSVCANNADITLDGSVTVATGGIWSGGAGTYNPDNTTLNAVYTPTAGEIAAGTITLTLTTTGYGNCIAVDDDVTITITDAPTVDAGIDQTVCGNNADVTLNGAVTIATGGVWSGGAGTYNPNNTTLNAVYTPTAGEITAGTVNLTLTTTGHGNCAAEADDMIITITTAPTVDAGEDDTICADNPNVVLDGQVTVATGGTWSGGAGTYNPDNTTLNTIYTPSAGEISAGTVTLTLTTTGSGNCTEVADDVVITINPAPTADAGLDIDVCENNPDATLDGSVTGATGGKWSGGAGTYNPNDSTLNAVYTPTAGEIASGSVNLTLTTTGNGVCFAAFNEVMITIHPEPIVDAGNDKSVCASNPDVNLNGSVTNATGGLWSGDDGDGSWNPDSITLNTVYTPSAAEIASGTVTLILTTTGQSAGCAVATDTIVITINPTPALSSSLTPPDICSGTTFNYTATSATGGATFAWSRAGVAGISEGAGSGAGDVSETLTNETTSPVDVTYVYITTANGCDNSPGENVVVTVNPTPVISNLTEEICTGGALSDLTPVNNPPATIVPSNTTYSWPAPVSAPGGAITNGATGTNESVIDNTTLTNGTNLSNGTAATATLTYTVTATSGAAGSCTNDFTVAATIYADISNVDVCCNQVICDNSVPDLITGDQPVGGTGAYQYQWYVACEPGWTPSAISGATNKDYQISAAPTSTCYYYRETSTDYCGTKTSNNDTIFVGNPSQGGYATPAIPTLCPGISTTITLTGYTGSIQWQDSTSSGSWQDISNANSDTYNTPNLSETTHYRAVVTYAPCDPDISSVATVSISPTTNVWTGQVNTDWHNPANWACGGIPTLATDVIIPDVNGASGNFPEVRPGWSGLFNTLDVFVNANVTVLGLGRLCGKYPCAYADAGDDKIICGGTPATIGTSNSEGDSFVWTSNPAGFNYSTFDKNDVPQSVNPAVTTNYSLAVTDGMGNVHRDTATVSVVLAPTPVAGSNISTCMSTLGTIQMTGASATGTYSAVTWSGGSPGTWVLKSGGNALDPADYEYTPATNNGSFTATLTLTGSGGCSGDNPTSTRTVAWGVAPDVDPGSDITACTGTGAIIMSGAASNLGSPIDTVIWSGGNGTWSWLGADGTVPADYSFTPNLSSGTFTATVTMYGGGACSASSDAETRIITWEENTVAPTTINASYNPSCAGSTTTLTVADGSVGSSGTWNWYTGGCGNNFIDSGSSIDVTPSIATTYYVRAESAAPCNTTSCANITINIAAPSTTANAGGAQDRCDGNTSFTMDGNAATGGNETGVWTCAGGCAAGVSITTPGSATSEVIVPVGVSQTFTWTLTNANCASSSDDVVISHYAASTMADAGTTPIERCNGSTSFIMDANAAAGGSETGVWTCAGGNCAPGVSITTPASETSEVIVPVGASQTFTWTITNGTCASSSDDVVVSHYFPSTVADAGADQERCDGSTTFTMAAVAAAGGSESGVWTCASGCTGVSIATSGSETSDVTVPVGNITTFTWTITNGTCASTSDDVVISHYDLPCPP